MTGQHVGNSLYGLQSMGNSHAVRQLLSALAIAVTRCKERLVPGVASKRFEISKFNSNARELELTNLLGLVLGCVEVKCCK